jgi:tRNA 2-selenouridine synthase
MIAEIQIPEFISRAVRIPVVDVRSPGEYLQGHIPGAISLPLFDNEERKIVGTIYKQQGRKDAILKGFEIAGGKTSLLSKTARNIALNKELLVHCWRGGMRSTAMAWLFQHTGKPDPKIVFAKKSIRISGSIRNESFNVRP